MADDLAAVNPAAKLNCGSIRVDSLQLDMI